MIIKHVILPIILLCISILGIVYPYKTSPTFGIFDFKLFRKNHNTFITSRRTYGICLLIEAILYSALSILVITKIVAISNVEIMMICLIMLFIPILIQFIVHFIKFDRDGNLR